MADKGLGSSPPVSVFTPDTDKHSRIIRFGVDAELGVRHTQHTLVHDVLNLAARPAPGRIPGHERALTDRGTEHMNLPEPCLRILHAGVAAERTGTVLRIHAVFAVLLPDDLLDRIDRDLLHFTVLRDDNVTVTEDRSLTVRVG